MDIGTASVNPPSRWASDRFLRFAQDDLHRRIMKTYDLESTHIYHIHSYTIILTYTYLHTLNLTDFLLVMPRSSELHRGPTAKESDRERRRKAAEQTLEVCEAEGYELDGRHLVCHRGDASRVTVGCPPRSRRRCVHRSPSNCPVKFCTIVEHAHKNRAKS